jgi:glycosyltransferase involved in cell wall biosynthesis
MSKRRQVVIVSRIHPFNRVGNGVYTSMFIRAFLARGWDLVFVGLEESALPVLVCPPLGSADAKMHFTFRGRTKIGRWHLRRAVWPWMRFPLAWGYRFLRRLGWLRREKSTQPDPSLLQRLARLRPAERAFARPWIARLRPDDVLISNYAYLADILNDTPAGVRRVVITHDILFRRMETMGQPEAAKMRTIEQELLGKAGILVAIQDEEAGVCRTLAPRARVVTVSLAVEVSPESGAPEPGRLLFVGSSATHNVDGLNWFLSEVWTDLVNRHPGARLTVCGSVCEKIGQIPTGVELVGRVTDLAAHYQRAALVIVPLREGSGLKIKLMEALAAGCAVVSTGIGLQGVEFLADEGACLRADSVGDFASQCSLVLTNDARRHALMVQARRSLARFGEKAVLDPFFAALDATGKAGDSLPRDLLHATIRDGNAQPQAC